MPVVVVALAAGSFAAGATAFAAAAGIAASIAAGATMVGAALTIVGTVTGNAKLAKIGAIVGLAGGIGTMLTAGAEANATAAATSTAGDGATAGAEAVGSAAGDAAAGAAQTFPVAAPGGVDVLPGASGGGMLDSMGSSAGASAATPLTAADLGSQAVDTGMLGSLPDVTDPLAQAQASTTSALDAGSTVTGQSAATSGQAANAFDPNAIVASPNADMSQPQMPTPLGTGTDPGRMAQMAAWVKQNPELAKMALSAGGAAIGNLVPSSKDKAMMDAYKAQSAMSAAQTDALKRKAAWGAGRTTY